MSIKPVINLPMNPSNYYGTASTFRNIAEMSDSPTFYIGEQHNVQEMKALSVKVENNIYTIETDKAILVGNSLTRVNLKSDHNINRKESK